MRRILTVLSAFLATAAAVYVPIDFVSNRICDVQQIKTNEGTNNIIAAIGNITCQNVLWIDILIVANTTLKNGSFR